MEGEVRVRQGTVEASILGLESAALGRSIALADGADERSQRAAESLAELGAFPVLATSQRPRNLSAGVRTVDPATWAMQHPELAAVLTEVGERMLTRGKGDQLAVNAMLLDPLAVSIAAVRAGVTDGCVAGATRASAEVARWALRIVGLAPSARLLSSSFLMILPDKRIFAYGDCAVVPEPNAEQLAEIAIATADTFSSMTHSPAHVALLSFSTKGSAEHESISVVREAAELVRVLRPELMVDGELQFDAALVPEVGETKAAGSTVAGRANVFIFPNLAAGNIAYKITERLGGAHALGPLLQGLAAPINDLSRGCNTQDVFDIALVTLVQAAIYSGTMPVERA